MQSMSVEGKAKQAKRDAIGWVLKYQCCGCGKRFNGLYDVEAHLVDKHGATDARKPVAPQFTGKQLEKSE